MCKFLLYKFGQFIVNRLPIRWSYCIAGWISDIQYLVSFRDRRNVRNNVLAIARPGDDVTFLTKEVFRNFGRYLVEFFKLANAIDREFIRRNVTIHNLHYLQEALACGKGVVLVSGHIGNWELGGLIFGTLGYPTVAVALPHKERPVNELFNQQRAARGVEVIPSHLAVRRCLEALQENKIVAVIADRDFGNNGIIMDFLGRKAMIPKGAALFGCKTGAAIVPVFLLRDGKERFTLIIERPVYPQKTAEHPIPESTLIAVIKQYLGVIEQQIRQRPDQWLMFRSFWVSAAKNAAGAGKG